MTLSVFILRFLIAICVLVAITLASLEVLQIRMTVTFTHVVTHSPVEIR